MDNDNRDTGHDTQGGSESASDISQEERQEPLPTEKPSQAEGDRETIETDIRQKERRGEL